MWEPNSAVLTTDLGDELVLMEPVRSVMFSLNETGRLLWNALPADETALGELLGRTYDLAPADALRDVQSLMAALAERGLVQPS
ncbi:PqqD family protein [Deinococcus sp. PESE-13]